LLDIEASSSNNHHHQQQQQQQQHQHPHPHASLSDGSKLDKLAKDDDEAALLGYLHQR